jgi:hypothetical protein
MNALHSITGNHVAHAFLIGLAAGALAYIVQVYALGPLESTLGLPVGGA